MCTQYIYVYILYVFIYLYTHTYIFQYSFQKCAIFIIISLKLFMSSFFFHFLLLPFRYMFGLSVIPALLQFLGFLFLPESPRWLIQRGLTQKARRVLSQIRGNQNIDEEYDSIKNSIEEEEKDSGGGEWKESQDMCEKGI